MDLTDLGLGGMDWINLAQVDYQWGGDSSNKSRGSIKCWKVTELVHNWLLLKKGCAP
jgi:hypothetical protein